uniref:Cholecystokinin 1 n=1 Tax=Ophionotus victoriae TaxID=667017 RepID=A0A220W0J0_9ECHI|nr:cholecystokinin 1 precursor [Ophionotus victoriae]
MTGDVPPLLLAIVCLFLTTTPTVSSLPSKSGNIKTSRDLTQTDIERLILNTIENVQAQAINRQNNVGTHDDLGEPLWKPENTWKTPTLPDLIQDWKDSVKERHDSLADTGLLQDIDVEVDRDEDDIADKRSKDYGWGMAFGKRGSRTQNDRQTHKIESRNKDYGWGMAFGKRNEYGWGHMFGKRNLEQVDYDDFVA